MKPQSHQIGRVQSLLEILAPGSTWHRCPPHFSRDFQTGFPKNTYLSHFDRFGIAFMKTYEGAEEYEHKENKYGNDYLGVFLSVCVCEVRVLGISIMVGTLPLGLLQRCSILVHTESSVNLRSSSPCPNMRLHSPLCEWMQKDICSESVASIERWWSLYDMVIFTPDRAFLNIPF